MNVFVFRNSEKSLAYRRQVSGVAATAVFTWFGDLLLFSATGALRLETEALLCPFDDGPCRADLGLADGAGCFNVNDDAELHVDVSVPCNSPACIRRARVLALKERPSIFFDYIRIAHVDY